MPYHIDQSGKIEDTNRLTIVAFANGKAKSLKISGPEKQKLVSAIRALDYPKKTFIFRIFAGLIFLLIRNEKIAEIVIDEEYPGHEATIKNLLLHLFRKSNKQPPNIIFMEIGKRSLAHKIAWDAFRNKKRVDIVVKSGNVLELFYK